MLQSLALPALPHHSIGINRQSYLALNCSLYIEDGPKSWQKVAASKKVTVALLADVAKMPKIDSKLWLPKYCLIFSKTFQDSYCTAFQSLEDDPQLVIRRCMTICCLFPWKECSCNPGWGPCAAWTIDVVLGHLAHQLEDHWLCWCSLESQVEISHIRDLWIGPFRVR